MDRGGDERRRSSPRARPARRDDLGVDLHLLDLDKYEHRLHYDVISNGVLWFLFHDLFDTVRRPRVRPPLPRGLGRLRLGERVVRDAAAAVAPEGDIVLVQDYQLALVPAQLRALRPDLRIVHFTHTPFCGPDGIRLLPTDVAEPLCASLAGGPAGFHTPPLGRVVRRVGARGARRGRRPMQPFAASLGPDVDALARSRAEPATRDAAGSARRRRR